MKSIKKIKESGKAVAGTALLVGATLAGGAAFATASSHGGSSGSGSMSLGDYPAPFIGEDGTVDSTIVMGEDAKATDVVAAANIAGQLGNDAFSESEETVSVEGSFGWSATNGVSLDTRNDQLFFGDTIDTVRSTLTEDHLDVLQTQEVLTGDAEQEVEQYLYLGDQSVSFGTPGDTDGEEDPFLYVNAPETPDSTTTASDYLYRLQANFQDGVEFHGSDGPNNNINEDVYGQEISMFGTTYTIADASFTDGNEDQLILYGSSEQVSVDSGQSETVTIGGEEVTVEVVGVTGENTAAVRINGDLEQYSEDDEETIGGEDLRVDNIIQTNADNSQGVVQFAIGSEQVTLQSGEPVMLGDDDEEVDSTLVNLEGTNVDDGTNSVADEDHELSSVEIAVGTEDSDDSYVRAGEMHENPIFPDVEFHFGGLNPDAGEGASDSVGEVEFSTDGDDAVTASISDGENEATFQWAYDNNGDNDPVLTDEDDDEFIVKEGVEVTEDDYVATDAGDFSHMWEVTSIDRDTDDNGGTIQSDDEATIELEDVVTGASVEVDLDAVDPDGGGTYDDYAGTEVIDGQTYSFFLDGDSSGDTSGAGNGGATGGFHVVWGDSSSVASDGSTISEGTVSLYSAVDTDSGAALALTERVSISDSTTYELPSTDGTDEVTVEIDGSGQVTDIDGNSVTYADSGTHRVAAGGLNYALDAGNNEISLDSDQTSGSSSGSGSELSGGNAAAAVIQPQADDDNEESFVINPGFDSGSDNWVEVGQDSSGSVLYSGSTADSSGGTSTGYSAQTLESDDDVETTYSEYGTHTMFDTEDQGVFTLHIPDGQSTAGAAVTSQDGSLEASASGSGSVTTMMPTGWPAQSVALDSDSFVSSAKQDSNLILVGGPAANSLVSELATANKTWETSQYEDGQGLLQLVPDAFNEDHHALVVAGYSGEDTRAAGDFLTNYEQNEDALAGESQVEISTAEGTVVQ